MSPTPPRFRLPRTVSGVALGQAFSVGDVATGEDVPAAVRAPATSATGFSEGDLFPPAQRWHRRCFRVAWAGDRRESGDGTSSPFPHPALKSDRGLWYADGAPLSVRPARDGVKPMARRALSALLLTFLLVSPLAGQGGQGELERRYQKKLDAPFMKKVEWAQTLASAKERARRDNLPILAYFTRSYAP